MKFTNLKNQNQIIRTILKNQLVLMETDTVLGIYCKDVQKIYQLKQRPENKKIVLLIANIKQIANQLPKELLNITNRFWPGALTIIYKQIAYRIPKHEVVLKILKKVAPVYCSSANLSGEPFFKNSDEALSKFKRNSLSQELLIVEGKSFLPTPSTIYDFDRDVLIREGAISLKEIRDVRSS